MAVVGALCQFASVVGPAFAEAQVGTGPTLRAGAAQQAYRCDPIAAPPRRLETSSKYVQSIASKSVIDLAAAKERRESLQPVEAALAQLSTRISAVTDTAVGRQLRDCAAQDLASWAAQSALTDMASSDANLTRDRYALEIARAAIALRDKGRDLSGDPTIRRWLLTLARQSMDYYDRKAGPVSRGNNHRYWAGVSVATLGGFLGDAAMKNWAIESFRIGACQIDAEGFLPLELARANKAYDYHLYAFRALTELRGQILANGGSEREACGPALVRLASLLDRQRRGEALFETRSGFRQDRPSGKNLRIAAVAAEYGSSDLTAPTTSGL